MHVKHYRSLAAMCAVLAIAGVASADVKVVAQQTGKMMGMTASGETVTYIKGLKMRTDQTMGGRKMTTIMDLETGEIVGIDHGKKEAEIYSMGDLRRQLGDAGVEADGVNATITPLGETKQVAGYTAAGHNLNVSVSATMGGPNGMPVTVTISGPAYLSADAPGVKDYANFYIAAAEKGFFFGDPRAAKAQPGNARGMMALYKAMAEKGIPLQSTQTVKMSGDGPMAAMLARMGGGEMTTTVTSVSADVLAEDLFAVPAAYKQKRQKID